MPRTAAGIDIGTTSISVIILDLDSGEILENLTAANPQFKPPEAKGHHYLQDPLRIEADLFRLLSEVKNSYSPLAVTGQVHGILYYEQSGKAVSPLYTWLDQSGTALIPELKKSAQQLLAERTGKTLPAGYGLLTHYTNSLTDAVPKDTAGVTGIIEYITGRLVGKPLAESYPSSLGAYGFFDPVSEKFYVESLQEIFSKNRQLNFPSVSSSPFAQAGISVTLPHVPVSCPVGDNQAGFFGMVPAPETQALINVGTSGQISLFSNKTDCPTSMELRPFFSSGYLHVGATLAAGKAYEVVQRLFKSILNSSREKCFSDEEVYSLIQSMGSSAASDTQGLLIRTEFNGTRSDSALRGSIEGIDLQNLTDENLILGTANGVIRELYAFASDSDIGTEIVATGNAIRKNPLFQQAIARIFNRKVHIAPTEQGAAVGIALVGAISAGCMDLKGKNELAAKILAGTRSD